MRDTIKKIITYRNGINTVYIIEYLDGSTKEVMDEYFCDGNIISDSVKYHTEKIHKTHNARWCEYYNPAFYLFADV